MVRRENLKVIESNANLSLWPSRHNDDRRVPCGRGRAEIRVEHPHKFSYRTAKIFAILFRAHGLPAMSYRLEAAEFSRAVVQIWRQSFAWNEVFWS